MNPNHVVLVTCGSVAVAMLALFGIGYGLTAILGIAVCAVVWFVLAVRA
jgi:hypothetical protein